MQYYTGGKPEKQRRLAQGAVGAFGRFVQEQTDLLKRNIYDISHPGFHLPQTLFPGSITPETLSSLDQAQIYGESPGGGGPPGLSTILLPKRPPEYWYHTTYGPLNQLSNVNVNMKQIMPRGLTYFAESPRQAIRAAVSGSEAMHRARLTAPTNVFELSTATPAEIASLKEGKFLPKWYDPAGKPIPRTTASPFGPTRQYGNQIRWPIAETPAFQGWLRQHGYQGVMVKDEAERSLALFPERIRSQISITGQYRTNYRGRPTREWIGERPEGYSNTPWKKMNPNDPENYIEMVPKSEMPALQAWFKSPESQVIHHGNFKLAADQWNAAFGLYPGKPPSFIEWMHVKYPQAYMSPVGSKDVPFMTKYNQFVEEVWTPWVQGNVKEPVPLQMQFAKPQIGPSGLTGMSKENIKAFYNWWAAEDPNKEMLLSTAVHKWLTTLLPE